MKSTILISIILFCYLFSISTDCKSQTNEDFSEVKISQMIKDFYTGYYNEKEIVWNEKTMEIGLEKLDSIIHKYCTINLINQIRDVYDYDPFIDSNNYDEAVLKTLTVTKDKNYKDLYHVSYIIYNSKTTIKLIIRKQFNQYKIDYLWLNHSL